MAKSWCFHAQNEILSNFNAMWYIKYNIHAPVLLNLVNLLQKSDKNSAILAFDPFSPTCLLNSIQH